MYARGVGGDDLDDAERRGVRRRRILYVTCSGERRPARDRADPPAASPNVVHRGRRATPTACVVSPDGDAMLVVESHAQRIVRVPIEADGSAGRRDDVRRAARHRRGRAGARRRGHVWATLYRPDGLVGSRPDGRRGAADRRSPRHDAGRADEPRVRRGGPRRSPWSRTSASGSSSPSTSACAGRPLHYPEVP